MRDPGLRALWDALQAREDQNLPPPINKAQLAGELGITKQALSQWRRLPVERVLEIEQILGIPCHVLRPDLYREPPPAPVVEPIILPDPPTPKRHKTPAKKAAKLASVRSVRKVRRAQKPRAR